MTFPAQSTSGLHLRAPVRLLAIIMLSGVHLAALATFGVSAPKQIMADAIEVAIETHPQAQSEILAPPPESEPEPVPLPEPIDPQDPEPDIAPVPQAQPPKPETPPRPKPNPSKPTAAEIERLRERRAAAQQQAQQRVLLAAQTAQARGTYAAIVAAKINAAKFYPADARQKGIIGSVGVRFSIGPDGRITEATLVQSSGSASLDAAALQIFKSLQAPAPPGAAFYGAINIRYTLGRP
jgi:protein TonB